MTRLRPGLRRHSPGLVEESRLWESGVRYIVGVDEVGRGAWAGPISVGAAVIPQDRRVYKVRDSKLLTESEREELFERVSEWCVAWSVGHASSFECDELGMSAAQKLATQRAIDGLGVPAERVLVDGNWDFVGGAETIVGGDRTSLSIAAASILAKVTRDRIMRRDAPQYPAYNFEGNKGYPCPVHKAALYGWGPSTIHRQTWAFMDGLPWNGTVRLRRPEAQLSFAV